MMIWVLLRNDHGWGRDVFCECLCVGGGSNRVKYRPGSQRTPSIAAFYMDVCALCCRFLDGSIPALEEYVRHTPTAVTAQPQPHPTCPQAGTGILRRHADEFSYEDFVADFLLPNQPVLIQVKFQPRHPCPLQSCPSWMEQLKLSFQLCASDLLASRGDCVFVEKGSNECCHRDLGTVLAAECLATSVWNCKPRPWTSIRKMCESALQGTNRSWRASEEWVTADGSVDVDFLREKFGGATVSAMESSR